MERKIGKTRFTLIKGDITTQRVDALVNAANAALSGGGGVDGAIHRAAGPTVMAECRAIEGGCATGQAVVTGAGDLPIKRIVHAVGPVWHGGHKGEAELLASAYRKSLEVAMAEGCRSMAFPSLSTGAYRYPVRSAAAIAVATVIEVVEEHPEAFDEIRFVVFSDADLAVYEKALDEL